MTQSLFQQRGWPEERPSVAEQEGQDSSTDCTLNNSLLDIQTMDSTSWRQAPESIADGNDLKASNPTGASRHSKGSHNPSKFTFSSFSKKLRSSSAVDTISPNCCGQTADLTVSSSESQVGGAPRVTRTSSTLSDVLTNCLVCFWPTMHSVEERPHNDCFIAVDYSTGAREAPHWHASYPDTPVFRTDQIKLDEQPAEMDKKEDPSTAFTPLTKEILSLPNLPISKHRHLNIHVEDNAYQTKLARLTPITVQSRPSLAEQTKNGATMTSTLNTLHRRNDDFTLFTAQTLDAIHSSPTKMNEAVGTPRNQDNRMNMGGNKLSAFQTPGGNRARVDSETFRRTIKVVTCEKRKISDDSDVSPIDSDAGFSPMLDSRTKRVATESLPPRQTPFTAQKRLMFDVGSVRRYATPNVSRGGPPSNTPGRNLFQDFAPEPISEHLSPLSEFGMSVMKSLQSIVQGRPNIPSYVHTTGYETDKENMPGNTPTSPVHHAKTLSTTSSSSEKEQIWQDTFLQKSSSFLKALRRTGRRGKVLIQGWVAFRDTTVPWKEIIRNPKRCDFRYIVLLDDMPLLHMFSSRPKHKKLMPKHDLLRDCTSLDLTNDNIVVKVGLVSKEFGNEVYFFDEEKEQYIYGLMPIPMPQSVFCDKHQSRLAKGDALKSVFEPFKRSVTFASSSNDVVEKPSSTDLPVEQYDVSRHLLFVLDCAIKFPLNNGGCPRKLSVWL